MYEGLVRVNKITETYDPLDYVIVHYNLMLNINAIYPRVLIELKTNFEILS